MSIRGIRGAITVEENSKEAILSHTEELLSEILHSNHILSDDIASIFFSVTTDLNAEFPALAARKLGLKDTPLLCLTEIPVPGSLSKCIRILIHLNTSKRQSEMIHVYLKGAVALRPEFAQNSPRS